VQDTQRNQQGLKKIVPMEIIGCLVNRKGKKKEPVFDVDAAFKLLLEILDRKLCIIYNWSWKFHQDLQ